jgi:L-ascorbate metabolism protein UlaG (beta-lactamase superfamily)
MKNLVAFRGGMAVAGLNPFEAALAAEYLGVKIAIPMHYVGDECAENFLKELKVRAPHVKGLILKPGETSILKG